MNVVGTASPLPAEFLLLLIHSAWCLLPYSPGENPLLYPLPGLHIVELGKKLSTNYKAKQARIEPFEKLPACFGSIVAKDFVGNVYINNRAHLLQPQRPGRFFHEESAVAVGRVQHVALSVNFQ